MGFLSKAWKGLKKVIKKTARTVKKIAKKAAYALPGGKQLWKLGGKIGTKVLGAVGKVVNKLGPAGMIALSVLAPYAAPLWHAFGATSAAAGGFLGSIGTAVYNAGNWVAGTLGSMSEGISKAIGTIADGGLKGLGTSLGKAAGQVTKGFADAFTGTAGAAGIEAGKKAAFDFALKEAAGQSLFDQTVNKITGDIAGDSATQTLADVNKTIDQNLINLDPSKTALEKAQVGFEATQAGVQQASTLNVQQGAAQTAQQFAPQTLKQQGLSLVQQAPTPEPTTGSSLTDKAGKIAKAMIAGDEEGLGFAAPLTSVGAGQLQRGDAFARGGVGSGGGNFLSQAMLQAMQAQQQRMTRGFG